MINPRNYTPELIILLIMYVRTSFRRIKMRIGLKLLGRSEI